MKSKLTGIFVIMAILLVIAVFNFDKVEKVFKKDEQSDAEPITKEVTYSELSNSLQQVGWLDYNEKPTQIEGSVINASKVVYVHLWASWCAPCLNEIPELIAFAKKNKDRVSFVLVSLDDSKEDLAKFLKSFPEMNSSLFSKIWDKDKKLSKLVDADRLPMTIILDSKNSSIKSVRSVIDWKNI